MDPSILWGQDHGCSPLEREAASASGTGGSEELLTFLRVEEEQQPCWARETKFTLSCSFKTTARQGGRVDAPAVWPWSQGGGAQGLPGEGLCLPEEDDIAQGHVAQGREHHPA